MRSNSVLEIDTTGAHMAPLYELISRVLLSAIFLISSIWKISDYAATQRYMELQGVSDWLLPIVIVAEILLSVMVILGWHTRLAAFF